MALYTVSSKVTLEENKTKSLVLIKPTTVSIKIRQVDLSLSASTAQEEVQFDLYRVETIGSPTGTAATPVLADERDGAATSSALTALTVEPTAVKVITSWFLQPLGGLLSVPFPYGSEVISKLNGERIGLRAITTTSKPIALATVWFEE